MRTIEGTASAAGFRFALVVSRYNDFVTDRLQSGAVAALTAAGATGITVVRVPGAFEIPIAAQRCAQTGRFDAVVCLGAVVRGDTPHFDYVAGECARGLQDVSIDEHIPVIFGVLTTNTHEQAVARVGGSHGHAGERAAEAAVEMIAVLDQIAHAGKKKSKAR